MTDKQLHDWVLEMRLVGSLDRSDTDVALAVGNALKWNRLIPANTITPAVSNGRVTLTGELDWNYQRLAAAAAVRDLAGVRGVINDITIRPSDSVTDVKAERIA